MKMTAQQILNAKVAKLGVVSAADVENLDHLTNQQIDRIIKLAIAGTKIPKAKAFLNDGKNKTVPTMVRDMIHQSKEKAALHQLSPAQWDQAIADHLLSLVLTTISRRGG